MNLSKIKNVFLKVLIGCLIAAAALAVVTVLVGKFNDVLSKSLFTILIVALHSLISFGFITNNEKQNSFETLGFFPNATFAIIVLSFITATLGIWGIAAGDIVGKLYLLYFVLLFAILHGEVLDKTVDKQTSINRIVSANYVFMFIVVAMLIPAIFTGFDSTLGSFYYRLLAAIGIIDATLTLNAIILHRIYLQKHPKVNDPVFAAQPSSEVSTMPVPQTISRSKHGFNTFVYVLAALMAFQLISGIIVFIFFSLSND